MPKFIVGFVFEMIVEAENSLAAVDIANDLVAHDDYPTPVVEWVEMEED